MSITLETSATHMRDLPLVLVMQPAGLAHAGRGVPMPTMMRMRQRVTTIEGHTEAALAQRAAGARPSKHGSTDHRVRRTVLQEKCPSSTN